VRFEAYRLLAQHTLRDVAVEEGIGDVQLVCGPVLRGDECQNGAYGGRLDDR
jgi:hypothetical protein